MKHGRRPTLRQKEILKRRELDPKDWLVCVAMPKELQLKHRHTGIYAIIPEGIKGKQEIRKEANA